MRTKLRSKISLLFVVCAALLAVPVIAAVADTLNDELTGNNLNQNTVTVTQNDPNGFVNSFHVRAQNSGANVAGDCDVSASAPATFDINTPTGVTATPNTLTFTQCGTATTNTQDVKFTSSVLADPGHVINVTQTGGNTIGTGNAEFRLKVVAPADTTAPVISNVVTGTQGDNGWYTSNVGVDWTVSDPQSAISSQSGCNDFSVISDQQEMTYTCTAASAGGTSSDSVTIKRDATAPVVNDDGTTQSPNGAGWYNSAVTNDFSSSDATSGLADSTQASFSVSSGTAEGAAVKINSGPVSDNAGNTNPGIDSAAFKIDQTAPVVAYKSASPAANANGWNNTNVTATFEATDSLSGMGATDADKTATNTATTSGEGTNVSVGSPAFTDRAGNTALADATTSPDFKIDLTNPLVSLVGGPANNGSYYFGSVPNAPTCTASDALSLLAGPCQVNGYGTTVGSHTVSASATDNADNNATTASRTYSVLGWTLKGFYSPVDYDITTTTGVTTVWNTVKGGATVPLKFEVLAGSIELTDPAVVDKFTATPVKCPSGFLTTDDIEILSTGGTTLRYDGTAGQFIQNWQTPKKPGACYDVTMTTDDGTSLPVAHFQLK